MRTESAKDDFGEGISLNSQTSCPVCRSNATEVLLDAPDRYHGRTKFYSLLRCATCSLVWLANAPLPDEMGQHYGEDYDLSVATAGESLERWSTRKATVLNHFLGGDLLDLGCSSGGFLSAMKSSSWRLHGVEMSGEVAKRAEVLTGAKIFVGDIVDAPFSPASFDVITCFHVLEHMYKPAEILAKVYEWLKPGGIFFLMVPNIDSAGARIFRSYWYPLELPRHLFHFSPVSLRRLAHSVGLRTITLTTHRELFVEQSGAYLIDDLFAKLRSPRAPLCRRKNRNIFGRIARKVFRISVLPVFNALAAAVGDGESIHAIFTK